MASFIRFSRKIRRSGGTLVVTIPPELISALNLKEGQDVEVFVNDNKNLEIQVKKKSA